MTINITPEELACDCDAAYWKRYGQIETINGLAGRIARNGLTDDELRLAADCQSAEQLHAKLHPDRVSLDDYRQAWFAAHDQAAKPAATQPAPAAPAADTASTDPGDVSDED